MRGKTVRVNVCSYDERTPMPDPGTWRRALERMKSDIPCWHVDARQRLPVKVRLPLEFDRRSVVHVEPIPDHNCWARLELPRGCPPVNAGMVMFGGPSLALMTPRGLILTGRGNEWLHELMASQDGPNPQKWACNPKNQGRGREDLH